MPPFAESSLPEIESSYVLRKAVVGVIGLGYVGTCLAAVLGHKGFAVRGVDTDADTVRAIAGGKSPFREPDLDELLADLVLEDRIRVSTGFEILTECDVVLLTVGTPITDAYAPDLRQVTAAAEALARVLRKDQVVILKSTVVPKTTGEVVRPILEKGSGLRAGKDFGLAFCPERFEEGNALKHLRSLPVVVGADDPVSAQAADAFWRSAGLTTVRVGSSRAAELVKLVDNLWIDVNIALANEVALLAEHLGVDSLDVIRAANTLPKGASFVNVMTPGPGAGGSCLTKDPWFVDRLARESGLSLELPAASRRVHEHMPDHVVHLVQDALREKGRELAGSRVTVLGLAFKERTSDVRGSTAVQIADRLRAAGADVVAFDPWVGEAGAAVTKASIAPTIDAAVAGADCVVLATAHPEFVRPVPELLRLLGKGAALVDTRHVYHDAGLAERGIVYRGLGQGAPRPPLP